MINILGYANQFKSCARVSYTAYVCKVPVGCAVLNPIADYKAVCLLWGRLFLSNQEVMQIRQSNINLYNLIQHRITQPMNFVININGILEVISFDELSANYTFGDGSAITQSRLLPKSYICEMQNGLLTPVDITLSMAYEKKIKNPEANLVIPYFRVIWKGSSEEEVLFIDRQAMPEFILYLPEQNKNYMVIVANSDERTAKIISEDEYKYKYSLKGRNMAYKREPMKAPEPLFELSKSTHGVNAFAIVIDNVIKERYNSSFAIVNGVVTDISTEVLSGDCLSISFRLSFADTFLLAYRKNKEFCLASGSREVFNEQFAPDINKYIKYLENNKNIMLKDTNFKRYLELFTAFLTLENSGVVSNYYNPPMTANELISLKQYSGNSYRDINMYLRGSDDVEDKFSAYVKAVFIQEIIEKSLVLRNQYHFRGASIDLEESAKLKEGYVIKHPTFISTSIACSVTFDFVAQDYKDRDSILLVFRNTANKHGIYIDNYSSHRGKEFEVLFGVGSGFKLIRKLGYYHEIDCKPSAIWLCEIEEDPNVKIRKYAYQKDEVEKLLYMVQSSKLMKAFYISDVMDGEQIKVMLSRYNTEDLSIGIYLKNNIFTIQFVGYINEDYSFSIKEKGYNHLFQYIYFVLNSKGSNQKLSTSALTSFSEKFMLSLMSTFTYNGFIISKQQVNIGVMEDLLGGVDELFAPVLDYDKVTGKPIESRKSGFTILNADAQPIKFDITIKTDNQNIMVGILATEGKKKLAVGKFQCGVVERFSLYEQVYTAIVRKFHLDPVRRLKHIFSIVSGYYEKYLEFAGKDGKYGCYFDERVFRIEVVGTGIKVLYDDSSIEFNYFDDIYEVARKIQTMI